MWPLVPENREHVNVSVTYWNINFKYQGDFKEIYKLRGSAKNNNNNKIKRLQGE